MTDRCWRSSERRIWLTETTDSRDCCLALPKGHKAAISTARATGNGAPRIRIGASLCNHKDHRHGNRNNRNWARGDTISLLCWNGGRRSLSPIESKQLCIDGHDNRAQQPESKIRCRPCIVGVSCVCIVVTHYPPDVGVFTGLTKVFKCTIHAEPAETGPRQSVHKTINLGFRVAPGASESSWTNTETSTVA